MKTFPLHRRCERAAFGRRGRQDCEAPTESRSPVAVLPSRGGKSRQPWRDSQAPAGNPIAVISQPRRPTAQWPCRRVFVVSGCRRPFTDLRRHAASSTFAHGSMYMVGLYVRVFARQRTRCVPCLVSWGAVPAGSGFAVGVLRRGRSRSVSCDASYHAPRVCFQTPGDFCPSS